VLLLLLLVLLRLLCGAPVLQIQEHVSAPLLEGLMEGTHTLPAGHLVPLPHPVSESHT
jgi:hypothetical protein